MESPDPMGLTDGEPVTLIGGVLHGCVLDVKPGVNEVVPLPHHYRDVGVAPKAEIEIYKRWNRHHFVLVGMDGSTIRSPEEGR